MAAKLLAAVAVLYYSSATCRFCKERSRVSTRASFLQLGIFVAALASIPWFLDGDARIAAAYLVAALILAIGFFAPMTKDVRS